MCGKMQDSGVPEIIPLMCTSAFWDQYPVLSHPESPQGASLGASCSDGGHDSRQAANLSLS